MEYFKKYLVLKTVLTTLLDQLTDLILIVTLVILGKFWFAAVYLVADIMPALIIIWQKFHEERTWRVLVNGIVLKANFSRLKLSFRPQ